ncbi:IS21-like element helper ATPase IstB [Alkalihalobacillus sp. MEB130]|uniref:IS21-like element helper ATPase IstB n=1 Tax=Alkalihalobacillus sp. MEB130 TaxID=2976704 RepID=UPI0028DD4A30|nr:IS21-like element helper ATPase IstB [Alkalihalobacillus sp. MEB130]MDT8863095.1 IS21-like element helper ATPase IstB [Alkalihalobacillus sp. MEB130]
MSDPIRSMCKSLRLAYVAEIYETIPFESPSQFLEAIFNKEFSLREKAKVQRLIKNAKFLDSKSLSNYEWNDRIRFPAQIDKEALMSLDFIKQQQNVVLIGSPGTGKTHLATGLGRKACEMGHEVRFFRVSHLIEQLEHAFKQDKLPSFRKKFEKVDLIILDEMGYLPFSKEGSELLFQLIAEWYEQKSLIITSNLEFSQWNRIFIDSRLTAALVDRLIHHAHVLTYSGGSYRLSNALSKAR